jgi:hypothetical protein
LRWLIALAVVLLFIVPPFWDWLPTRAAHSEYCANEGGFHQFKTFQQWKDEHPLAVDSVRSYTEQERNARHINPDALNTRFQTDVKIEGPISFNLFRIRSVLFDGGTGEVLADFVDFQAGYGNWPELGSKYRSAWKIWLAQPHCPNYLTRKQKYFSEMAAFEASKE